MKLKEKIKKSIMDKRSFLLIGLLLAILCFIPVIADRLSGNEYYGYFKKKMIVVDEMESCTGTYEGSVSQTVFGQTFLCIYDTVTEMTIKLVPAETFDPWYLDVKLKDEAAGTVVEEWTIDAAEIGKDGYVTIKSTDALKHNDMRGRNYILEMVFKGGEEENVCGFYGLTTDYYKNGSLYINGKNTGGDIIMTVSGYDGVYGFGHVRIWLCIFALMITEGILYYARRRISATM